MNATDNQTAEELIHTILNDRPDSLADTLPNHVHNVWWFFSWVNKNARYEHVVQRMPYTKDGSPPIYFNNTKFVWYVSPVVLNLFENHRAVFDSIAEMQRADRKKQTS